MNLDTTEMNERLVKLAENSRFWRVGYGALSAPERVFRAVWEVESEVNNGGFHQYFLNSSGGHAQDAVGSLKTIGAAKMAGIVQRAIKVTGYDASVSDDARKATMIAMAPKALEKLDKLDQAFYAYPDNLTELLYKYVSEHADEITATDEFHQQSHKPAGRRPFSRIIRSPLFLLAVIVAVALVTKLISALS